MALATRSSVASTKVSTSLLNDDANEEADDVYNQILGEIGLGMDAGG